MINGMMDHIASPEYLIRFIFSANPDFPLSIKAFIPQVHPEGLPIRSRSPACRQAYGNAGCGRPQASFSARQDIIIPATCGQCQA
jgi:hypothetical protein